MKIHEINHVHETKIAELIEKLKIDFDVKSLETELTVFMQKRVAPIIQQAIVDILSTEEFLVVLSFIARSKGLSFSGFRPFKVLLFNGIEAVVISPYFYCPREKKRGRKKKGRKIGNNFDCHLGLSLMGFVGRYSPYIVQEVVSTSLASPSFAVAKELLKGRGIDLSVSVIEKLCIKTAQIGLANRGKISLTGDEDFTGLTLVIGTDGGRIRIRTPKPGRKKKGGKRQGYKGEWKEPKLIIIYLSDHNGKKIKSFPPIYDATMGDEKAVFDLIRKYLAELPLTTLKNIVFCGDGAPWIWKRTEELYSELSDLKLNFYQVLDYTHAKQALKLIWDMLPKKMADKQKQRLWKQLKDELWNGNIDIIKTLIIKYLSKRQRKNGLKKWKDYFKKNEKRMQYSTFKKAGIICGSGCVESAIRRVINLRLKAPGIFWKIENAEYFLFLRSQFISGRFGIFTNNLRKRIFYNLDDWNDKVRTLKKNIDRTA